MADPDTTQWNGYTATPNAVLFHSNLSPAAKVLYGIILCLSRREGYCHAAEPKLGRYVGLKRRMTRYTLATLEAAGLVRIEPQTGGTNHYYPLVTPGPMQPIAQGGEPAATPPMQRIAGVAAPPRNGLHRTPATHYRGPLQSIAPNENGSMKKKKDEDLSNRPPPNKIEPETTTLPVSPWITNTIFDYSRQLGDETATPANIVQALRLWQESGLYEEAFIAEMHTAYGTTQRAARVANKGAYFFTVLREQLQRRAA